MNIELNKYHLLQDGKIVKITLSDCENILSWYDVQLGGEFTHLNDLDLDYLEAKKLYGRRCVGVSYIEHSGYHFFKDDENPSLFFILPKYFSSESIDFLIKEFNAWFEGEIYDVQIYTLEGGFNLIDSYLYVGVSYDADLSVVCDVTNEMNLIITNPDDSELVEMLKTRIEKRSLKC